MPFAPEARVTRFLLDLYLETCSGNVPLPLGEGGAKRRVRAGNAPSSGPSGHLLPEGEGHEPPFRLIWTPLVYDRRRFLVSRLSAVIDRRYSELEAAGIKTAAMSLPDASATLFQTSREDLFGGHVVILETAEVYSAGVAPRKREMPPMAVAASQRPSASKVALSGATMDCPRKACHVRIPAKLR